MNSEDKEKILAFLRSPSRNEWLNLTTMNVYVRKSRRDLGEATLLDCFDIANIEVHEQSVGGFTNLVMFLSCALCEFNISAIYIESVINVEFANRLRQDRKLIGYQEIKDTGDFAGPSNFVYWL